MKKSPVLLVILAAASASLPASLPAARADVSWNHVGSVKIGNSPIMTFSMQNQWSGPNHRTALSVDATSLVKTFEPSSPTPARGGLQVIEKLDADRLIISSPQSTSYFDEPLKSLKGRLRLNFWEVLGSKLSPNDIPELTPAQRQRLGQEIRALTTPFAQKVSKTYFRAIPETRTIGGMVSHGFRYTQLINIAPEKKAGDWVRANAEWWIAEGMSGDEEIRAFTQNANQIKGEGPTSASMWANEYGPVLWEAAPVEAHQALDSMIGAPDSSRYGFQGTPVQFFVTISAPPSMKSDMGGDLKFSLELKNRHTNPSEATLFEAPTGGDRVDIEPFLGIAKNFMKIGKAELEKMMK